MEVSGTLIEREHLALRGCAPGRGARRATRRTEERRTCEARGCETILSAYNAGAMCWQHEAARSYVPRGRRLQLNVA